MYVAGDPKLLLCDNLEGWGGEGGGKGFRREGTHESVQFSHSVMSDSL